ncbi:MAG: tryptophan--tRNA ligase [Candidatus Pacebacteria bacterium]|jgi:tryptophanyl-tRNA synthetase|nr:tryptophan--tRNA ligase [Candidatus Paceibacterota bacterium]
MQKTLLSGVKPTGIVHLGNYFGAMRQFVDRQDDYRQFIFIANYHALTSVSDGELLKKLTLDLAMDYLAIGIDPKKTTLFLQSDVPEVTELAWIFNTLTTVPYLSRAHAFKDAEAKNHEVNVGLFDYPILMAADILVYNADVVPVGLDQKQHIEIARDTAQKFNNAFGETFKMPEPIILENVQTVVGTDGRKMSKSYNNTIPLFGTDEEIKKAVMSIPTDSKGVEEPKDPATCKVFALHELFPGEELEALRARYEKGGIGYKESKDLLVAKIIAFISPMRTRREEIARDPEAVMRILREGGEVARAQAQKMMIDVRAKVGLTLK